MRIIALTLTILLTACAISVPQSADEFRSTVDAGGFGTHKETHAIKRPFNAVYANMKEMAQQCLSVEISSSVSQGANVSASRSTYRPSVEKSGHQSASLILQVIHSPQPVGATIPPGGLYMLIADINGVSANETRLVMYGGSVGQAELFAGVEQWLGGQDKNCPLK